MVGIGELIKQGETFNTVCLAESLEVFTQGDWVTGDIQNPRVCLDHRERLFIESATRWIDKNRFALITV